jgi:hypothetical protein
MASLTAVQVDKIWDDLVENVSDTLGIEDDDRWEAVRDDLAPVLDLLREVVA